MPSMLILREIRRTEYDKSTAQLNMRNANICKLKLRQYIIIAVAENNVDDCFDITHRLENNTSSTQTPIMSIDKKLP